MGSGSFHQFVAFIRTALSKARGLRSHSSSFMVSWQQYLLPFMRSAA